MYPPIFEAVVANAAVRAQLGANPTRFYQFGMAPQTVKAPYAVWRRVGGFPDLFLGEVPDTDFFTLQIDVFSNPTLGAQAARNAALPLRDALEPVCNITQWLGEDTDPQTGNPVFSFQLDWILQR